MTSPPPSLNDRGLQGRPVATPEVAAALGEAAAWRLLSLLLERPRQGWAEEVRQVAAEVPDRHLREVAAAASGGASEGAYLGLLGPGGPASPREAGHQRFADPGATLARLTALYDAFGYRPASEDPQDHAAVEAGFAGFLELKRAYALATGEGVAAASVEAAQRLFLAEHLGALAVGLASRLAGTDSYLESAASALAARIASRDPG